MADQVREFHFSELPFGPDLIVGKRGDIAVQKYVVVFVRANQIIKRETARTPW